LLRGRFLPVGGLPLAGGLDPAMTVKHQLRHVSMAAIKRMASEWCTWQQLTWQ
jgi:hypothetical protein